MPPIIFSAGFSLKKSLFFSKIKYILLFGIFGNFLLKKGTLINFFVTVFLTIIFNNANLFYISKSDNKDNIGKVFNLNHYEIFLIAATTCASDSVAALVYKIFYLYLF